MRSSRPHPVPATGLRVRRAGLLTGLGFGGLFDGILLHQILQWHHLLSGVPGAWAADLRHQVLADGLFHAVMVAALLAGLALVLRARQALAAPTGARRFTGAFVAGFGVWHVVDALLSHGILQLHHIRMDTEHRLAWDLGWLLAFGIVPLVMARALARCGVTARHAAVLPLGLVGATVVAACVAMAPSQAGGGRVVVLAEEVPMSRVFDALAGSDARVVSADRTGRVWLLAGAGLGDAWTLYRHGALYVSGTVAPAGCAAWPR